VGGGRSTGAGWWYAGADTNGAGGVRAYRHRLVAVGGTTEGARDMRYL
jgi:hypothetical protein